MRLRIVNRILIFYLFLNFDNEYIQQLHKYTMMVILLLFHIFYKYY